MESCFSRGWTVHIVIAIFLATCHGTVQYLLIFSIRKEVVRWSHNKKKKGTETFSLQKKVEIILWPKAKICKVSGVVKNRNLLRLDKIRLPQVKLCSKRISMLPLLPSIRGKAPSLTVANDRTIIDTLPIDLFAICARALYLFEEAAAEVVEARVLKSFLQRLRRHSLRSSFPICRLRFRAQTPTTDSFQFLWPQKQQIRGAAYQPHQLTRLR